MYLLHLCMSGGIAFVSRTCLQFYVLRPSGKAITTYEGLGNILCIFLNFFLIDNSE